MPNAAELDEARVSPRPPVDADHLLPSGRPMTVGPERPAGMAARVMRAMRSFLRGFRSDGTDTWV